MRIDHVHFFVEDAVAQRTWFTKRMGWKPIPPLKAAVSSHYPKSQTEYLQVRDLMFAVSSPRHESSPVAHYLQQYAPGVADIAVRVSDLDQILQRVSPHRVLSCDRHNHWARIRGWGSVNHTLLEEHLTPNSIHPDSVPPEAQSFQPTSRHRSLKKASSLDHLVLNVPAGELQAAVQFYQHLFDFQPQQTFQIQTQQSGLHSQVLYSPKSQLYFNINEPASPQSQIQIFLDANRGAGIQHLALKSEPLVDAVARLRTRGLPLLPIASSYYQRLRSRLQDSKPLPISAKEWQQIIQQQILVDWQPSKPDSLLLQIFSKPIFQQPTFFLSLLSDENKLRDLGKAIFWRFTKQWKQSWSGVGFR